MTHTPANPFISIVMAACNAADTIDEAIASVKTQRHPSWELLVVDDGSSDSTVAAVARWCQRDARIRLIRQENAGPSVARNRGIAEARGEFLLFFDSDDWLERHMIARMHEVVQADQRLDYVFCSSIRVSPDGTDVAFDAPLVLGDLFWQSSRYCLHTIHAAITRRTVILEVGAFDPDLRVCEDWDLWTRVARRGVRWRQLEERLVRYRARDGSLTSNAVRAWRDGRKVVERLHDVDPRLAGSVLAEHRNGAAAERLPSALAHWVGWPAGITLSRGESALPLLKDLPDLSGVHLDSEVVAATLWSGLDFGTRTGLNRLARNWPAVAAVTREWVEELGARAQAPAVVPRVMRRLELLLADLVPADARPDRLGHVGFRSIELSQLDGPVAAEGCERLRIRPSTNGVALREVTVPVAEDGMVSRATILDAVGWLDGWSALEEYFARSLYPSLERRTVASGVRICRNGAELAMMSAEDAHSSARLHQEIGWCVFLQELWGERSLPLSTFYDTVDGGSEEDAPLVRANGAVVPIELSDPLPIVSGWSDLIPLEIRLGGARVGALHLRGFTDPITPAALRGQITRAFGLGLMRVAVRQAVLGWPPGSAPLRERLREAARTHLPLPVTSSDLAVDVVARSKLEGWRKVWASLTPRSGTERRAPMRAESLRILMYHRVATDGDPRARRYRITPEEFGRQLDALSARGFTFRSLSWCHEWLNRGEPFPMKSVVLTFDDAYLDFYEYAWPILQARSLSATLFVPTGFVGKSSEWDKGLFTPSPLLSWQQITRLHAAGIEIGAHTVSHPALTSCSPREIATELTESRRTLEDVCSEPIRLFAYPYGDCDTAVRTLVGDAGYSLAVTTRPESARPSDDPLTLPRVEVLGGVPFERFERAIS